MNLANIWTDAEKAQLRAMRADHTSAQISAVLGRSAKAVCTYSRVLGIRYEGAPEPMTSGEFVSLKVGANPAQNLSARIAA